jgi:sugar (pentulose or hexulose) kinase
MEPADCILIFDIGKTNKKVIVLDESYKVLYEQSVQLEETTDEDGFPCEDIHALTLWVQSSYKDVIQIFGKKIKTVNCSAYGASLVHVDVNLKPIAPLYNYLKPFPAKLQKKLYNDYGGEEAFSLGTSSPSLGSLNSGLQLYRLKKEQPALFEKIKYSVHLPQYISSIFSRHACSDLTSIGCHTALWDFSRKDYHKWVIEKGIISKLAPVQISDQVLHTQINDTDIQAGIGLHDSSAALIPYLHLIKEPFLLISTGTWCISLNPFNNHPLTEAELKQDCLCYLTTTGNPVKASRLFAGRWHEEKVLQMAAHFHLDKKFFSAITYNPGIPEQLEMLREKLNVADTSTTGATNAGITFPDMSIFPSAEIAYAWLVKNLIELQADSTNLILNDTDNANIYVDGGFSNNQLYMHLLAKVFPDKAVYAADIAQASVFGAAISIHRHWNKKPIPTDLISQKRYM